MYAFFPALRPEVKWSHLLLLYYLNHKFKSSISYSQERVPRTHLDSRVVSLIRLSVSLERLHYLSFSPSFCLLRRNIPIMSIHFG